MISNRIGRLEFLFWCCTPVVVVSIASASIAVSFGETDIQAPGARLHGLFALVLVIASIVILRAGVSRLHDLGWSGPAILLMFVPMVDLVVFLLLLFAPGQKTRNRYGEPSGFLQRMRGSTQVPLQSSSWNAE